MDKWTITYNVEKRLSGELFLYFAKRRFFKKRKLCISIYKYSDGTSFSHVYYYNERDLAGSERIDDAHDSLLFKSLFKAKELGWYISSDNLFFQKDIVFKG